MAHKVRYEMLIDTDTNEEKERIGDAIHRQLKGNQDYIDCKIILNIDQPCRVILDIFDDATIIPVISIPFHREVVHM